MFEGVHNQEQFHQFLAAAAAASNPASSSSTSHHHHHLLQQQQQHHHQPLSFSLLHGCNPSPSPSIFHHDPYNPVQLHHQHILHPQQIQWAPAHSSKQQQGDIKQERHGLIDSSSSSATAWSHDELQALLRIRSALENWFPEFTWEHVSRKLSELGFKRSPQKCKERFEEESRLYFHGPKNNDVASMENDKANYRLFSELEELCHHPHPQSQSIDVVNDRPSEDVNVNQDDQEQVEDESEQEERVEGNAEVHDEVGEQEMEEQEMIKKDGKSHRKGMIKKKKFEIFKSFCEEIVGKMMSHQEELHKKILEDMITRDEAKTAREEAWRSHEMERINKEMEARARDLAMVSDRQAKIIEFLEKFASDSSTNTMIMTKKDGINEAPKSTHQNPSSSATHSSPNHLPTSSNEEESISQSSNPTKNRPNARKPRPNKRARSENCSDGNNDIGKRWPRDEVLALIKIRCNVDLASKNGPEDSGPNKTCSNSNSGNKNPPLWERISLKMVEMGYSRSAKRCKEKWENINKYFRKTKDMNKNRSVDSRTCPYFHQLNHLYNQGRVAGVGGSDAGGGGGAMNVDVSDHQGEEASGVQATLSTAACELDQF